MQAGVRAASDGLSVRTVFRYVTLNSVADCQAAIAAERRRPIVEIHNCDQVLEC
jgi:hypothetical protein